MLPGNCKERQFPGSGRDYPAGLLWELIQGVLSVAVPGLVCHCCGFNDNFGGYALVDM
jgi:hypothetical protein